MKLLKKYLTILLVIMMLALLASYAITATGIPVHRVGGGINTSAFVANAIMVIDKGYINQIREGNISNHTYLRIQGQNLDLDTAKEEISDLGTASFGNWPSAAAGVILVSTSANDDSAGTGARTVIVRGLDSSYLEVSETVTMDGVTPTTITTQTFFRIHELEVVTAGTGLVNAGIITASISGTDIIALNAGHGKSQSGRYTVPADNTAYFENFEGSSINASDMAFYLFIRDSATANASFTLIKTFGTKDSGYMPDGKLKGISEKYDIILVGEGEAVDGIVSASLEGWIET